MLQFSHHNSDVSQNGLINDEAITHPATSKHIMSLQLTIFLLVTILPFHGNTQSTTNQQQEASILLQLKQHWSNPSSLAHWAPSPAPSHCTWPEVTCAPDGSVTALTIVNASIAHTIPWSICNLTNLTRIDLQWNLIPGRFPTALYNCTNLEYLDLSFNYLIGTIPISIGSLSPRLLRVLNLTMNNFTGHIPPAIGRLTSLRSLQLSTNLFDASFPAEIGDLSNLEELVLSNNPFAPQAIPSSFTKLRKLKNMWITGSNLIGEIPDGIGNMSALEFLDLSENKLTGGIPDSLFLLKNLTDLFLYKNSLSGSIPRRVETLKMQVLDLSNNSLTGTIPDDFGKLSSLTGLALYFNQLSGEVTTSIGKLPKIVDIGLFNNNLSGVLPPDFGRYSKLERFQVSSNQFEGELPKYLCENMALIGVIAFENKLMGGIPDSLGDCDSLKIVRVQHNQLSGDIPGGLWTSKNLDTLTLGNNMFSGKLPDKVGPSLSLVEVMNNRISGSIPVGISSWEKLTELRASNNLLSGSIPQELTSLKSLSVLLMDGNRLSGPLPSVILSWESLVILNLSRNQLRGEIPASIALLPHLNDLDLSMNELTGAIPPQIGRLRLSELNLSSNRLSGRVPREYENAAFDSSFSSNPGLCSDVLALGLASCGRVGTRKTNKHSSQFIAAVSSIAGVALLGVALYTIYAYRKGKQMSSDHSTWKLTSFQKLSFTEADILSGLKDENVIGSGGSGVVYRVPINGPGKYVAVKRILDSSVKLEKEFVAEVGILGTFRHSNIVKLLCCISSDNSSKSKLLVYEDMENRSLDKWLHGKYSGQAVLDWPKRLHIAIGAAQGLCYMHHHCSPPIIHRDIKSSNILLDSKFNAKIADFGLARMLVKDGAPNTMSVVAGSFGYIAPEYAQTRRVNEKIDVYGFGVILLELITGREAQDGDESSSLAQWAWSQFQQGKSIVEAVDEDIKEALYLEDINIVLKLGLMCTATLPSSRPPMNDVLQILLGCTHTLPLSNKTSMNEYEAAPLLHVSNSQRSHHDVFISISS